MSKLVVDIDKILSNLKPYADAAEEYESKCTSFKNNQVSSSVNDIADYINNYIDEISNKLNRFSNNAINFYNKVDNSCTMYQENEDDINEISIDNISEIIDTNPEITTEFKGAAAKRLSSFATTELTASAIYKAKKIIEKYEGRDISSLTHDEFLEYIGAAAQLDYKESGILPSVTIAQAICETGWGKYSIGNNLFGIKVGDDWDGKTITCGTKEQSSSGSYYSISATFRDYDSIVDGVADHSAVLLQDRYKPVIEACNNNDAYEACRQVKACGYATSHSYANTLISIIDDNDLTKYDNI